MFSIRKRLNYSNVVATLALFFAMSGGALAASHYLITSTKQIKPSVLKSLKGANGKNGAPGEKGANGTNGAPGEKGANGTNGTGTEGKKGETGKEGATGPAGVIHPGETLPAGASEHGVWGFSGPGGEQTVVPISFPIPIPGGLNKEHTVVVPETEESSTKEGCEGGSQYNPIAKPGYLCVYVSELGEFEREGGTIAGNPGEGPVYAAVNEGNGAYGVNPSGGLLNIKNTGTAGVGRGVWVVTAP